MKDAERQTSAATAAASSTRDALTIDVCTDARHLTLHDLQAVLEAQERHVRRRARFTIPVGFLGTILLTLGLRSNLGPTFAALVAAVAVPTAMLLAIRRDDRQMCRDLSITTDARRQITRAIVALVQKRKMRLRDKNPATVAALVYEYLRDHCD